MSIYGANGSAQSVCPSGLTTITQIATSSFFILWRGTCHLMIFIRNGDIVPPLDSVTSNLGYFDDNARIGEFPRDILHAKHNLNLSLWWLYYIGYWFITPCAFVESITFMNYCAIRSLQIYDRCSPKFCALQHQGCAHIRVSWVIASKHIFQFRNCNLLFLIIGKLGFNLKVRIM